MSWVQQSTGRWLVICDGCGIAERPVESELGDEFPPEGWTQFPTGKIESTWHACAGSPCDAAVRLGFRHPAGYDTDAYSAAFIEASQGDEA